MGFADGLMEVRRLVMGVQSHNAGPFLQNLVADAASFLARLRREPQNDGGDLEQSFRDTILTTPRTVSLRMISPDRPLCCENTKSNTGEGMRLVR